jgi:hypothetical protein
MNSSIEAHSCDAIHSFNEHFGLNQTRKTLEIGEQKPLPVENVELAYLV